MYGQEVGDVPPAGGIGPRAQQSDIAPPEVLGCEPSEGEVKAVQLGIDSSVGQGIRPASASGVGRFPKQSAVSGSGIEVHGVCREGGCR